MAKAKQTPFDLDEITKQTTEFSQQCSDACTKSSEIYAKGFETIFGEIMNIAQNSAKKQAKFVKEALASKTINEFAEIQNKILQDSFDEFMTNTTKLSEISIKVAMETSEPMNEQINKIIQKSSQAMAA
ncbi:MAG: phasin family protein [Alphaproteobacteria bacterium]|nr:phasin family protein [Alphaproteobacteria bacterium]